MINGHNPAAEGQPSQPDETNPLEERILLLSDEIQQRVAELGTVAIMIKHPCAPPVTPEARRQFYEIGHALRSAVELMEGAGDHATAAAIRRKQEES